MRFLGTQQAETLVMAKLSWMMLITLPCDIPSSRSISSTFTRRFSRIILSTRATLSSVVTSDRRPGRGHLQGTHDHGGTPYSSEQWLHRKGRCRCTVYTATMHSWISFAFLPFLVKNLITARCSTFSIVEKFVTDDLRSATAS